MPAWIPSKEWLGQDAHLIGGGASLLGFDFNFLCGKNTIGCNDAYRLGPSVVHTCVFGDTSWWEQNKYALEKFTGRVVSISPTIRHLNLSWLRQLSRIRDGLHDGNTCGWNYSTGATAINVAISLGADRIYLLGYDLTQKQGKSHWHNHRKAPTLASNFSRFQRGFDRLAKDLPKYPGIEVINVSDGTSKLTTFRTITFEEWKAVMR